MSTFAQHIVHTCTLYWLKTNSQIIPLAGGNDSSHEQDNLSKTNPTPMGSPMLSQVWNKKYTQKYCI